ncbi:hypothetical protein TWF225_008177 [Orbilia oligospora]|uniref:Uncharacterized protein n=1 Tax=Orbilia oligospora TaxID=2813651 RepID=A0A8H2HQM9_ORBOL|nr:hypothetical protein TWF225_008177 [Orbilia oligospora]KAF3246431.1 hypothetical protein TWF128_008896 [Orbilia oligospora]KAF3246432.1 hypothetical protein TWF128_008896 [Orbilia oligospora]KAF3268891.1 hypothetical protein TWF217_010179 [Orbilia oligospora]KAF3292795.1 hypothetical protein TWF132_005164 [Orbilia oligospora]
MLYHSRKVPQIKIRKNMERQLPLPYKFLVIRKERDEWMLAHVSTFDCAEPPSMPILGTKELDRKDTRFQLAVYPTAALVFIENTIEKINASPSLEGTGCKYCILGADTAKKDDKWENICLVLKLANCNDSFKAIVGDPEYLKSVDHEEIDGVSMMLEHSALQTPMPSDTHTPA